MILHNLSSDLLRHSLIIAQDGSSHIKYESQPYPRNISQASWLSALTTPSGYLEKPLLADFECDPDLFHDDATWIP
jgi:hypothetical protein